MTRFERATDKFRVEVKDVCEIGKGGMWKGRNKMGWEIGRFRKDTTGDGIGSQKQT